MGNDQVETRYIDENTDKWEKEKKERKENSKKWLEDWAWNTRLEKIRIIKEKEEKEKIEKVKLTVTLMPERLSLGAGTQPDPQPDQAEDGPQPEVVHEVDQAEQSQTLQGGEQTGDYPCSPCEQ